AKLDDMLDTVLPGQGRCLAQQSAMNIDRHNAMRSTCMQCQPAVQDTRSTSNVQNGLSWLQAHCLNEIPYHPRIASVLATCLQTRHRPQDRTAQGDSAIVRAEPR